MQKMTNFQKKLQGPLQGINKVFMNGILPALKMYGPILIKPM